MKVPPITFKQLTDLLKQCKLRAVPVIGNAIRYEHASGAEIVLPKKNPPPRALAMYIVAARITLDRWGVLDEDDFNRRLNLTDSPSKRRARASA